MDPLTIATGAATLVGICTKCVLSLSQWFGEVKAIDSIILGFCGELEALKGALESLEWATNTDSMKEVAKIAESDDSNVLWVQIDKSMSDTRKALTSLEDVLIRISSGSKGVFRKPIKQFKTSYESGEISSLRQRIVLLNSTLNLPLQMLAVYMQAEKSSTGTAYDTNVAAKLDSLQKTVQNLQGALQARQSTHSRKPSTSEEKELYSHVNEFVRTARGFASNASTLSAAGSVTTPTIIETEDFSAAKTIPESVLGESLGAAKATRIGRWIPAPFTPSETEDSASPLSRMLKSRSRSPSTQEYGTITDTTSFIEIDQTSHVEEDDIDAQLLGKRLTKGRMFLDAGRYAEAIPVLKKALDPINEAGFRSSTAFTPDDVNLMLATAYSKLGKTKEAEALLGPLTSPNSRVNAMDLLSAKHLLADLLTKEQKYDRALILCRETAKARQKALGSSSSLYHESARLLIQIYEKMGDEEEAELWTELLPRQRSAQEEKFVRRSNEIDEFRRRGEVDKAADAAVTLLKEYTVATTWLFVDEKGEPWYKWEDIRKNLKKSHGVGLAGTGHGFTALHYLAAATPNANGEIEYLLGCGADINATWAIRHHSGFAGIHDGCTPLMMAAMWGRESAVKVLLKHGARIHDSDTLKRDVLHYAGINGDAAIINRLLDCGMDIERQDNRGVAPLSRAVIDGKVPAMKVLIERGAKIDARNIDGEGAIHKAAELGNIEAIQLLLDHGAGFEDKDTLGRSVLHHAVMRGHLSAVELLLKLGADVSVLSTQNWNAMTYAVDSSQGVPAILRAILDAAAKKEQLSIVNSQTNTGHNALHFAAYYGHEAAVDILLGEAIEKGQIIDIEAKTHLGWTALYMAVLGGHERIIRQLRTVGASVLVSNNVGWNALDQAVKSAREDIVELLLSYNTEADKTWLNVARSENSIPLFVAAQAGDVNIVRRLLDAGAAINGRDRNHKTVLELTQKAGKQEVAALLIERGGQCLQCACDNCTKNAATTT